VCVCVSCVCVCVCVCVCRGGADSHLANFIRHKKAGGLSREENSQLAMTMSGPSGTDLLALLSAVMDPVLMHGK
jgi:hypothetical protein